MQGLISSVGSLESGGGGGNTVYNNKIWVSLKPTSTSFAYDVFSYISNQPVSIGSINNLNVKGEVNGRYMSEIVVESSSSSQFYPKTYDTCRNLPLYDGYFINGVQVGDFVYFWARSSSTTYGVIKYDLVNNIFYDHIKQDGTTLNSTYSTDICAIGTKLYFLFKNSVTEFDIVNETSRTILTEISDKHRMCALDNKLYLLLYVNTSSGSQPYGMSYIYDSSNDTINSIDSHFEYTGYWENYHITNCVTDGTNIYACLMYSGSSTYGSYSTGLITFNKGDNSFTSTSLTGYDVGGSLVYYDGNIYSVRSKTNSYCHICKISVGSNSGSIICDVPCIINSLFALNNGKLMTSFNGNLIEFLPGILKLKYIPRNLLTNGPGNLQISSADYPCYIYDSYSREA